jgi:hypothetical protein
LEVEDRERAFISLKDLLDLPGTDRLLLMEDEGRETLGLERDGIRTPLEHMSAGYQTVIALGCDIMAGFGNRVGDMWNHTGVVLLDEIGTNLHPRWRLRIVQALRRTFPMMQFIASTHEPLCLRGLGQGEVCLLTLDKDRKVVVQDEELPSPALYRVDQLLTGDFFGLQTAYDPDEEAAFDIYHALLVEQRSQAAAGRELGEEKARLLEDLRVRLKGRVVLGATGPERMVLEALEMAVSGREAGELREPVKGSGKAKEAARNLLRSLPGNFGPVAEDEAEQGPREGAGS